MKTKQEHYWVKLGTRVVLELGVYLRTLRTYQSNNAMVVRAREQLEETLLEHFKSNKAAVHLQFLEGETFVNGTLLSVDFQLTPAPTEELRRVMAGNLVWRRERHPDLNVLASAGSIFQKIEGVGAGRLIDQCGLKGQTHGGAQIFTKHANIVVNRGGATAADVRALIELAQTRVADELGYELVPEIAFVGEF